MMHLKKTIRYWGSRLFQKVLIDVFKREMDLIRFFFLICFLHYMVPEYFGEIRCFRGKIVTFRINSQVFPEML